MKSKYIPLLVSLSIVLTACERQDRTAQPTPPSPANPPVTQAEPVVIPSNTTADVADRPAIQIPPTAAPATPPTPTQANTMPDASDTKSDTQPKTPPPNATESAKAHPLKVPAFTQQALPEDDLYLRFLATGETFYTEIKLEHGILNYTYFEDTAKRCAQWIKNTPCWQPADLKTISAALTNEELDNLYMVAKESGILKIKADTAGGAKAGQRYYAQQLEVRIKDKTKHLTYQSFPDAAPKPEAFARLETALVAYARDLPP